MVQADQGHTHRAHGSPTETKIRAAYQALDLGDYEGAMALVREPAEAGTTDGRCLWVYALCLAQAGAYDRILPVLEERYDDVVEERDWVSFWLTVAHSKLGNARRALRWMRKLEEAPALGALVFQVNGLGCLRKEPAFKELVTRYEQMVADSDGSC